MGSNKLAVFSKMHPHGMFNTIFCALLTRLVSTGATRSLEFRW